MPTYPNSSSRILEIPEGKCTCGCDKSDHYKDREGYWACLIPRCECRKWSSARQYAALHEQYGVTYKPKERA